MNFKDFFNMRPETVQENQIVGDKFRISILRDRLIRLEYSEDGIFEDRMTQVVWNRNFDTVDFRYRETKDELFLQTDCLKLRYDKKCFSPEGLQIELTEGLKQYHSAWYFGKKSKQGVNFKGTSRTLDEADGEIELEDGLMSRFGYSVIDDSRSLVLDREGKLLPRKDGIIDLYFFGYGNQFRDCLRDFHFLTGKTPIIPRYALGNWWSRYYPYTEEEYISLMKQFEKEAIPFSVAVIDMDWHEVDVPKGYGSGWTGYTWNKNLFPDYRRFLKSLHNMGMKVTLNEHPADGIQPHEEMYEKAAVECGIDPETREPILFDLTSPEFVEVYFKYLHDEYEKNGVDFWWIDWQQGNHTKVKGLDPLWLLNHLHFFHSARNGHRPLTFSRYAGVGSHRYPVGFSGDTAATWKSLEFQPYFTATASNIGFNWWSHDIGGHMQGRKDDELMVRWVQFGVFSPVMRLHSTNNFFNSKEPWNYSEKAQKIITRFLRLRHQMIPFLYSKNVENHINDGALVEPMYYDNPECREAYRVPNEYCFGNSLVVAPVTEPANKELYLSKVKVWLPAGTYIDFFTGMIYLGNRRIDMLRSLENLPVLAKSGSVIPVDPREYTGNSVDLPEVIRFKVFAGDNGEFTFYEDDGETMGYRSGQAVQTKVLFSWDKSELAILKPQGDTGMIPASRRYEFEIIGVRETQILSVISGNREAEYKCSYNSEKNIFYINIKESTPAGEVTIRFDKLALAGNHARDRAHKLLREVQIEYDLKQEICNILYKKAPVPAVISELLSVCPYEDLNMAFIEIFSANPQNEEEQVTLED